MVRTFLFVSLLCMFDYYDSVSTVVRSFVSMFTSFRLSVFWDGSLLAIGLSAVDYWILLVSLILVFIISRIQEKGQSVRGLIAARALPVRVIAWYGLFLIVILFGAYGIGYDATQFIYNQF